jgi:cobalt-zinc-cadmium efflux system outer membrane protein
MRSFCIPIGMALLCALPMVAGAQAQPPTSLLSAAATDAAPLTLNHAIERAFASNAGLRAAGRELDIAAGQRQQAGALPNPELSWLSEGMSKEARTTTIQLSQAIELGGKRGARIGAADQERSMAAADLAIARSTLRADVVTAFFDVVVAQELLALAHGSQELAQKVSATAARRVAAGKVSPVEQTRARVAESSARIELNQAASALALARRRLAATWGGGADFSAVASSDAGPAVPGPHDHASSAADELRAHLPTSPTIARARGDIARQQALADVERSKRVRDLTVSLGRKRDEQLGQSLTVIGVSIPLPLFDRNQGNLLSALRRVDKARDQLQAAESSVGAELAQATVRRDTAAADLRILREDILPGAQSAYDASAKGFELGKFGFLDVLDAQRTLFQARQQAIRAMAESYRAVADLERLIGTIEPEGRLTTPPYRNPQ